MNKISLKNLNLKEVEQLSREQLKGVLGGFVGSTGGTGGGTDRDCDDPACSPPPNSCETDSDCDTNGTCEELSITCCVTRSGGPEDVNYFFKTCKNF